MKRKAILVALAGVALLGACKSKTYEPDQVSNSKSADSTTIASDSIATKLVKTADINFRTKNVQQTNENISELLAQSGGMVVHRHITSNTYQTQDFRLNNDSLLRVSSISTNAELTVKLPVEKVDGFLNTISNNSVYISEQRMDIEDKSLDYLSAKLKQQARQEMVIRQKTGRVIIKDPTAVINLKDDLIDKQIDNKRIDNEVKYSTINLCFTQSNTVSKETVVNDDPSVYTPPFTSRFAQALANGWELLCDVFIGMANIWAIILFGIVMWLGLRFVLKKKVGFVKAS